MSEIRYVVAPKEWKPGEGFHLMTFGGIPPYTKPAGMSAVFNRSNNTFEPGWTVSVVPGVADCGTPAWIIPVDINENPETAEDSPADASSVVVSDPDSDRTSGAEMADSPAPVADAGGGGIAGFDDVEPADTP